MTETLSRPYTIPVLINTEGGEKDIFRHLEGRGIYLLLSSKRQSPLRDLAIRAAVKV
jgi:hypothetical protein